MSVCLSPFFFFLLTAQMDVQTLINCKNLVFRRQTGELDQGEKKKKREGGKSERERERQKRKKKKKPRRRRRKKRRGLAGKFEKLLRTKEKTISP